MGGGAREQLVDLAFAVCDGTASDAQLQRIEQILSGDPADRLLYLQCLEVHFELDRQAGRSAADTDASLHRAGVEGRGLRALPQGAKPPGAAAACWPVHGAPPLEDNQPSQAPPLPGISSAGGLYPFPGTLNGLFGAAAVAYFAVALLLGVGLIAAWRWQGSGSGLPCPTPSTVRYGTPDLQDDVSSPAPPAMTQDSARTVAKITGLLDCQWADANAAADGADVPAGRKFALASGLLEISYRNGVHVILQGPAVYLVESDSSGYLSFGKLTGYVPWQNNGTPAQRKIGSFAPDVRLSREFTVRTPSAVVASLDGGFEEFGVEVDRPPAAAAHVFRGKVELRLAGGPTGAARAIPLEEHQSARMRGLGTGQQAADLVFDPVLANGFARRVCSLAIPKTLDKVFVWLKAVGADADQPLVAVGTGEGSGRLPATASKDGTGSAGPPQGGSGISPLNNGITYTYRASFEVPGVLPATTFVRGSISAFHFNYVTAVRVNGRSLPLVGQPRAGDFQSSGTFILPKGSVKTLNTLEIDMTNNTPLGVREPLLSLRVEYSGVRLPPPTEPTDAGPGSAAHRDTRESPTRPSPANQGGPSMN